MEKHNESAMGSPKDKLGSKSKVVNDEARPVKWIQMSENVWRVVYAD